jgi:hypothetical protein
MKGLLKNILYIISCVYKLIRRAFGPIQLGLKFISQVEIMKRRILKMPIRRLQGDFEYPFGASYSAFLGLPFLLKISQICKTKKEDYYEKVHYGKHTRHHDPL